jgi:hypothetical protein
MSFYNPITEDISGIPIIIYPEKNLESVLSQQDNTSIHDYLETLYLKNKDLLLKENFKYQIIILWSDSDEIYADIWLYQIQDWNFSPLVDVKTFKGLELILGDGITAGDGLMMLGREEEHRLTTNSLEEYLNTRPELPKDITLKENFY